MQAAVRDRYGGPGRVRIEQVERPEPPDDGVLVRVRAASLNRLDWYTLTGRPWVTRPMTGLRGPRTRWLGTDFAGTVEEVGKDVEGFAPGDEVFGARSGALAEYVAAGAAVAHKPADLSFEEAAALPVAGLTALQGLRDRAGLRPGQTVLVNGASGGVGTYAVQIAKALGAEVTAVCRTPHVELVRSLGADRVVDYAREDFTRGGARYDVLFDNAGSRSWRACRRVLARDATVVLVGGPKGPLLGPLGHIAGMLLASRLSSRRCMFFVADPNRADLETLAELVTSGQVRPVIERRYPLADVADALRYMGEGHVQGKVVVGL